MVKQDLIIVGTLCALGGAGLSAAISAVTSNSWKNRKEKEFNVREKQINEKEQESLARIEKMNREYDTTIRRNQEEIERLEKQKSDFVSEFNEIKAGLSNGSDLDKAAMSIFNAIKRVTDRIEQSEKNIDKIMDSTKNDISKEVKSLSKNIEHNMSSIKDDLDNIERKVRSIGYDIRYSSK